MGDGSYPGAEYVQHAYSQQQVHELVEKARSEGYQQGYQEAEKLYNPPPPPPLCPDCGAACNVESTPFEQEYPGACYTPAQDWLHCPDCGHTSKLCDHNCEGQIKENTRGW